MARTGLCDQLIGSRLQRLQSRAAAILDLHLETAGIPYPAHRRRRKDEHSGILDLGELLTHRRRDGKAIQPRIFDPLLEGCECEESGHRVVAVGTIQSRIAGKLDRMNNARDFPSYL